jgi:prepilin-type N-terminal cleavage/methylation domain-containing protein
LERRSNENGMSLVEVMVALFITALAALAVVPMFATAVSNNATGGDHGVLAAIAVEEMESLLAEDYARLYEGGSLSSNLTGYFDVEPDYLVRWQIVNSIDPPNAKIITVRVIGEARGHVPAQEATVTTLKARP